MVGKEKCCEMLKPEFEKIDYPEYSLLFSLQNEKNG